MTVEAPDRAAIMAAIVEDLLLLRPDVVDDAVGLARVVCDHAGTCAGLVVAREIFARVGARTRALVAEGAAMEPGQAVAELGGSLAAIRGAAPLALTWLHRLSAVASGATPPEPGNELDAYAARLSAPAAVGHDGPSFHVEFEG
jgi:nicotinate-nucleotide pyrophosphorylase